MVNCAVLDLWYIILPVHLTTVACHCSRSSVTAHFVHRHYDFLNLTSDLLLKWHLELQYPKLHLK